MAAVPGNPPPRQRIRLGPRAWRYLLEMVVLLVLGAAAGVALNALRPDPLPYDLPGTLLRTESGVRAVFIREARHLFDAAEYVFVDAREKDEYLAGHIEGALSLPTGHFEGLYPELQTWSDGQPLLVYAGSTSLLPADELARLLKEAGESNVRLFASGYEAWRARGYPIARGAEGLLGGGAAPSTDEGEPTPRDSLAEE
jgi:rhodanese-related sulfurtransferase